MRHDKYLNSRIGNLISLISQPEFWGSTIGLLREYIDFETWCVLHYKNNKPHVLSEFDNWDDGTLFSKYLTYYYQFDPFYVTQSDSRLNAWTALKKIVSEDFYSSDYYRSYLSHFHHDEASLRIDLKNGTFLELSIGTNQTFNEADLDTLNVFRPWLVSLIQWRMWFEMTGSLIPQQSFKYSIEKFRNQTTHLLTPREAEVAELLCQSASNQEIANSLDISIGTVNKHVHSVLIKTKAKTRHGLFKYMINL